MASPQRFEGPVLADLLDRVRDEYGADARIVAANRVRKGGIGGFFAREYFEVVVDDELDRELDDATPAVVRGRGASLATAGGNGAATSLLEIVDEVSGRERSEQLRDWGSRVDPVIDLTTGDEHEPKATSAGTDTGFDSIDGAAADHRFARILDALERTETGALATQPTGAEMVAHPPETRVAPAARRTQSPDQPALQARSQLPAGDGAVPFVPPRVRSREAPEDGLVERPENLLVALGVPPRYVPRGVTGTKLRAALIESLAALPVALPLPSATGVVVAVVGLGARPVLLARSLLSEHGLDPDNLVLASAEPLGEGVPSWLQVHDAASAQERRRSWRRREHPTYVAVSMRSTADLAWAKELLDAMEPTLAWGIVDADRKPEDVRAVADRLGGFDVIALEQTDSTVSPAAILGLDLPVGRIDGATATPIRWAELLLSRIARR